jgi:hypothetical protein
MMTRGSLEDGRTTGGKKTKYLSDKFNGAQLPNSVNHHLPATWQMLLNKCITYLMFYV